MNITIFGSYNGGSIGDTAILIGAISSIYRVLGENVSITVLTMGNVGINNELLEMGVSANVKEVAINRKEFSKIDILDKFINKIWRKASHFFRSSAINVDKVRGVLSNSDLMIIGGGNLIMDLYWRWPGILNCVCNLSKDNGVPYGFLGVGAGPIGVQYKNILLECLMGAKFVYFRDFKSKEYCEEKLGFKESYTCHDLAFGIRWDKKSNNLNEGRLTLNLLPIYSKIYPIKDDSKYIIYIKEIKYLVGKLVKKFNISEVVIFNTNYPMDEFAVSSYMSLYDKENDGYDVKYVSGRRTVSALLDVCSTAKYSLVTRLHSGIISSLAGSSVIAISYQPKVADVMGEQIPSAKIIDMSELLIGAAYDVLSFSNEKKISCLERWKCIDDLMEKILIYGRNL